MAKIIGISGGSGSGKTTLANHLMTNFGAENCLLLSLDDFYVNLLDDSKHPDDINFDHPDSFDFQTFKSAIQDLQSGLSVEIPQYDFVTHSRKPAGIIVQPASYIIIEGLFLFNIPGLIELFDLKIFVKTSADIRLIRRIRRDLNDRGRTLHSIIRQYLNTVRPMHDQFVEPNAELSDIVVSGHEHFDKVMDRIQYLL